MLSTFLPQGLCTPHSFVSNVVLWSPLTHWISAQKCLLILSNAKYAHVPRCTPSVGSSHCASQTITMSACPPEHCLAAWPEHELHRCRNPVSLSLQGPAWYLIVRFVVLKKKKKKTLNKFLETQSLLGHLNISVQSLSRVRLFATPWTAARQASLSIINLQRLLKLMSINSVMPSNHLNLCHPLLLQPSIFPRIGVFSNESFLHIRWPKYWGFSFKISPSNEYSIDFL